MDFSHGKPWFSEVFGGSRTSTPFLEDVPSVLAIFVKHKQNTWDIRKKKGKIGENGKMHGFRKVEKTMAKLQKRRKRRKLR